MDAKKELKRQRLHAAVMIAIWVCILVLRFLDDGFQDMSVHDWIILGCGVSVIVLETVYLIILRRKGKAL